MYCDPSAIEISKLFETLVHILEKQPSIILQMSSNHHIVKWNAQRLAYL